VRKFSVRRGKINDKRGNDESQTTIGNNCVAFMFDEIRYEFNGVEIDRKKRWNKQYHQEIYFAIVPLFYYFEECWMKFRLGHTGRTL